ncbi:thermonuclease family protein [Tsuneonella amylolytica]|uniref:thermonuclease family protein n=1 Tax=Tsuneonella amylolytica TaxID=2338327 RepID=UPI000EAA54FD
MRSIFAVALAAVCFAGPVSAQTVVGQAGVVDGDTLRVGETTIRLFGIDAPEGRQTCSREGREWPCGEAATGKLRSMIEGKTVVCRGRGFDQFGRTVAVCEAGGVELNRALIAYGWATAFQAYSQDYLADETRAKTARLGIWDSTFLLPADYRRTRAELVEQMHGYRAPPARDSTNAAAPAVMGRCAIKGNRNRRGQWIYHLPGMPYYEATRPEEIFCTEAEAQAAGYRRAIVR